MVALLKCETQGQVRQLKLICLPEKSNGIGALGFKGEKGNSQDKEEQMFGN